MLFFNFIVHGEYISLIMQFEQMTTIFIKISHHFSIILALFILYFLDFEEAVLPRCWLLFLYEF